MQIKRVKQRKYCILPYSHLVDKALSFEAKGLLSYMLCPNTDWDGSTEDLIDKNSISKEELKKIFNELQVRGYLIVKEVNGKNEYEIRDAVAKNTTNTLIEDIKTNEELERENGKKEKLNLFQKCKLSVENYTDDDELRKVLLDYLNLRLNPQKESRLYNMKIVHINQWNAILKTLDTMNGNKVKIVEQSIEKAWAKFIDIENKSNDNVKTSSSYTKEELDFIKNKIKGEDLAW